jgi:hypothetical protein
MKVDFDKEEVGFMIQERRKLEDHPRLLPREAPN